MLLTKAIIITILSLATLLGCASNNATQSSNNENKVREISIAVEIFGSNYVFSDESIMNLGEITYSLRQKAVYGQNGVVRKLIVYKPEGVLEYNEEELLNDTELMINSGLPVRQNWRLMNNILADKNGNYISHITWVADSIYKTTNERYTIFYRIE